jgi:hypothetical protein
MGNTLGRLVSIAVHDAPFEGDLLPTVALKLLARSN